MSDRSLWFESHLFADRAGRRARAAGEQLGPRVHDAILAIGDRLAAASPVVAQQFYRQAPGVWEACGAEDFRLWAQLGEGLLAGDPVQRDAAFAFFSVAAEDVARAGAERLREWCRWGRDVAGASRKLGVAFFEGTAPLLARVRADRLAQWARQGMRLYGAAGWRGEFLAHACFVAAPRVLPVLDTAEIESWVNLGLVLHAAGNEGEFFAGLPQGLSAWRPPDRAEFFAAATALARVDARAAAAFYHELPAALRPVHGQARLQVLRVLRGAVSAGTSEALSAVVPVAGALVQALPGRQRHAALAAAEQVAHAFPSGAVALLRALPRAYESVGSDAAGRGSVERWVRRGLDIARENVEAGIAYFALESRTSVQVLESSSTAATLDDVQGTLRRYVQMLSGQPASIRAVDGWQLRAPLEEFPLENEIALPAKIDRFATHEDNCRLFRLLAAYLAGRREFATYAVKRPEATGGLLAHLRDAQRADLVEDLFLVADGFRVAAALSRAYPGIAAEQRALMTALLRQVPAEAAPPWQAFDALFAWLLSGCPLAAAPSWIHTLARLVGPALAPLAQAAATVDDALRIAEMLAERLALVAEQAAAVRPDAVLDVSGAETYLDPYFDDEGPVAPGAADEGPAPPPPEPPPEPRAPELRLGDTLGDDDAGAVPLSAEALRRLLEAGTDLQLKQGHGDDAEGLGLYITDLLGKLPAEQLEELRKLLNTAPPSSRTPRAWLERHGAGAAYYYDEWDYHIADYRARWCRLREVPVEGDAGEFFNQALLDHAALIPEVRRQFQRIRPEMYRTVKGLEDGEDFDLNAVVNARVEQRARRPPSPKLYVARTREQRDVATLFLIDMSASTDEPMEKPAPRAGAEDRVPPARRIIDVTKEALVIMATALEEIGDAYAIYGFSGHGRGNVEFYLVKAFNEPLSVGVKGRIGALEPKRSTRMGTALRHAAEKMSGVTARSRHIILLSDGFPQDFDYGQDRRSNVYGLRDTSAALREADNAGVTTFCITVDKAGHDYLREMCDAARYMVIEDIAALPRELPKIYQRVVGP